MADQNTPGPDPGRVETATLPPLTLKNLCDVLRRDAAAAAGALLDVQSGEPAPRTLDDFKTAAESLGSDLADAVFDFLQEDSNLPKFQTALRKRGVDLWSRRANARARIKRQDFPKEPAGVYDDTFREIGKFESRAGAFACRIKVGQNDQGSGIFISPRLVATAWHVLADESTMDKPISASIEIRASDGNSYPAKLAFFRPCHPSEWKGGIPTEAQAGTNDDIALLRVSRPVGYLCGHAVLPQAPCSLAKPIRFALVHFPKVVNEGLTIASVWSVSKRDDDVRYPHNALTEPGSSGGGAFNNKYVFIGLHQGRMGNFGRIVPYRRYANDPEFVKTLKADLAPTYVWSIDGTLDGELVIGRGGYQGALNEMASNPSTPVKMVWVRRLPDQPVSGLDFSYRILQRFLEFRGLPAPHRIALNLKTRDLFEFVRTQVLGQSGSGGSVTARKGVGPDEAAPAAVEGDRGLTLMRALARGNPDGQVWLYFDNAPAGLSPQVQLQLEQLVAAAMQQDAVRIVMAGYETYHFPGADHGPLPPTGDNAQVGYVTENIGLFTIKDVERTLTAISEALGVKFGDIPTFAEAAVLAHLSKRNEYDVESLPDIVGLIRKHVRNSLQ